MLDFTYMQVFKMTINSFFPDLHVVHMYVHSQSEYKDLQKNCGYSCTIYVNYVFNFFTGR
jgi:hypothetical protein